MNSPIRVVDLFCGGGGLSKGLSDAGYQIVSAFDNWDAAVEFHKKNMPSHAVNLLDLSDTQKTVQALKKLSFDLIAGGPPCQDFSSAGKRDETGDRANLTIAYASIICTMKPKLFIMENVDRAQKTKTFARAIDIFKSAGYGLTEAVLDASLCGVPQRRKRVIVFGILNGPHNALIPYIQKKQSSKPMTVRDCLGSKIDVSYYYRHPRSYARRAVFSIDEPSPTIRGVNRPIPQGYPGHAGDAIPISKELRPLTAKERSLIQTFPAEWDISGNKSVIEQIIGNAVPVKLAYFIGKCLSDYLSDTNKPSFLYKVDDKGNLMLFEQKIEYQTK
jgi:DNA (cytosine-5)-methyltransferase 1